MIFDGDKEEEEKIIMFPGSSTKKYFFQRELKGGRRHCKKVWRNKLMENCIFCDPARMHQNFKFASVSEVILLIQVQEGLPALWL